VGFRSITLDRPSCVKTLEVTQKHQRQSKEKKTLKRLFIISLFFRLAKIVSRSNLKTTLVVSTITS